MKNLLIIHYNTPELTNALIESIYKNSPGFKINVFDNSDLYPLITNPNVNIFDNTQGLYVDFDKWLDSFKTTNLSNDYNVFGSARHMKSVDICFDLLQEGFILLDSDVLVKKSLDDLWNENMVFTGDILKCGIPNHDIERMIPFVAYINVPMCKENKIDFCNEEFMWMTSEKDPNRYYDTGVWFLLECKLKLLPYKQINNEEYIIHYRAGSRLKDKKDLTKLNIWLHTHSDLFKNNV